MNFDSSCSVTYCWRTIASQIDNDKLEYNYDGIRIHCEQEKVGKGIGNLNLFGPTRSVVSGNFSNYNSHDTISFTTIQLSELLPDYKFNPNSSPEKWKTLAKIVYAKMPLYN